MFENPFSLMIQKIMIFKQDTITLLHHIHFKRKMYVSNRDIEILYIYVHLYCMVQTVNYHIN